jgi:hypothetical protein
MSGQRKFKKNRTESSERLLSTLKGAVDCPCLNKDVFNSRELLRIFLDKWEHFRARYSQPSLLSLVTVEVDTFLKAVSAQYAAAMLASKDGAIEGDGSETLTDEELLTIFKQIYPPDTADVTLGRLRHVKVNLGQQADKNADSIISIFGNYVSSFQLILRECDPYKPPQFKSVKKSFMDGISPPRIRASFMDKSGDINVLSDESLLETFSRMTDIFRKFCFDLRDDRVRSLISESSSGALADENASLKRKIAKLQSDMDSIHHVREDKSKPNKKHKRSEKSSKKSKKSICFGCGEAGHFRPNCKNTGRPDFVADVNARHPNCK